MASAAGMAAAAEWVGGSSHVVERVGDCAEEVKSAAGPAVAAHCVAGTIRKQELSRECG